ncbi:hypothetical protein B0H10DRAFT_2449663 [Mycena sp. CBHHK59/15]|nr:hypothetical protein B0H10DRAFT_2449663 [Mycena sp. CBHHK59/15]
MHGRGVDEHPRSRPTHGGESQASDRYDPSRLAPGYERRPESLPPFQAVGDPRSLYGDLSYGLPPGPGYPMRSRSQIIPGAQQEYPADRFTHHRHEEHSRRGGHPGYPQNNRSSSLNMATHEHPQYPASNVPAHQSQMDELLTRIEAMSLKQNELNERNEGLQQRTKELEAIIAAGADRSQRAIPDHRGAPPSLTSQRVKKSVYLGSKDLIDKSFKRSQAILQDQVSRSFREIIGVPGNKWPDLTVPRIDEVTDESYLNPMFEATVSHLTNQHLFDEVAKQVTAQLHGGVEFWPDGLAIPDIDAQWRVQVDDEAARMNAANLMTNRRRDRREGKAKHRGKEGAIEAVAAKYNVSKKSVAELLHEQHMSDEVSGPEDANDTSKAVWTTRMAFKTGLGDVSAEALKKIRFVEVLECPWRSDEMTAPVHDLSTIASGLLSENERQKIQLIRVPDTGRASLRIPVISPYNFGINKEWLQTNKLKPENTRLLSDWGKHPDPEGFGTRRRGVEGEMVVGRVEVAEPPVAGAEETGVELG